MDPPVRKQENTALLSGCGLTGTPLRLSLSGLGGRECSACVHSVDGNEVVLHSPLLVELQFVVCDPRSIVWRCSSGTAPITLTFPLEEQRRMKERLQQRNQDRLHVLYAPQSAL